MNQERDLLREIARIATDVGPALKPSGHDELLRSITETARSIFGASACSLALLEDDRELVFYVASGEGADDVVGLRVPIGHGIAGWVATSGQPIAIDDVTQDPRFASDVADATGYRPRSILAMPLQTERSMVGVIEVLDRDESRGDASNDMQLLGLFAGQAALAIENSRVFEDLGRVLLDALRRTTASEVLGDAIEATIADLEGPDRELIEIADLLRRLGEGNLDERALAVDILRRFLSFAQRKPWPS